MEPLDKIVPAFVEMAHRVVMPGTVMLAGRGEILRWQDPDGAAPAVRRPSTARTE